MMKKIAVLIAGAAVLAGIGLHAQVAGNAATLLADDNHALVSTIAFWSTRHDPAGNPGATPEIYPMDPDGTNVRRVTVDGIYAELFPVLRPDGKKLAFDSNRLRTAAEPLNTSDQEKEMIEAALAKSRGKVAGPQGAAAKLGVPASTLESKIRQLGIEKRRFTTAS